MIQKRLKNPATARSIDNLRIDHWRAFLRMFAGVVVTVVLFWVSTNILAGQRVSVMQSAERWAEIANMRLQIARNHELQAEQAFKGNAAMSFETPGDLLDFCGDEKFTASENYQKASQDWENAAKAYESTGDSVGAKKARENASIALEAAKRTISEGSDLYLRAKDQHAATNDLSKQIQSLEKATRNFERLMKMK